MNEQAEARENAAKEKINQGKVMLNQISAETTEDPIEKTHIKTFLDKHSSQQSEATNSDNVSIDKFKSRNLHGHASDSQLKDLIYNSESSVKSDIVKVSDRPVDGTKETDEELMDLVVTKIEPAKGGGKESSELIEIAVENEILCDVNDEGNFII